MRSMDAAVPGGRTASGVRGAAQDSREDLGVRTGRKQAIRRGLVTQECAPNPPAMPFNILVVEDDDAIRETLQALLEQRDYDVTTASNGKVALEMLETRRPNLILLDLMMPILDGWEFLKRLNNDEDFADIPVLVVSAASDRVPKGHQGFFRKPLDLSGLLERVQEIQQHGTVP